MLIKAFLILFLPTFKGSQIRSGHLRKPSSDKKSLLIRVLPLPLGGKGLLQLPVSSSHCLANDNTFRFIYLQNIFTSRIQKKMNYLVCREFDSLDCSSWIRRKYLAPGLTTSPVSGSNRSEFSLKGGARVGAGAGTGAGAVA